MKRTLKIIVFGSKEITEVRPPAKDGKNCPIKSQLTWNEYKLHIDLYKFYFGIVLKAIAFFYAIAGAVVLAYYSTRVGGGQGHFPRTLLIIPIILSAALAGIFFSGAILWKKIVDAIEKKLNDEKGAVIQIRPEIKFLYWVLRVFVIIFIIVFALFVRLILK